MIVVVLLAIATGGVLLWALYTEQVPPPRSHQGQRWAGLPSPADIRRRDFPLVIAGYDPQVVDAHLRAVAQAFARVRVTAEDARVRVSDEGAFTPGSSLAEEQQPDRPVVDPDQPGDGRTDPRWAPPVMPPGPSGRSDGDGTSRAGPGGEPDRHDRTPGATDE